MEELHIINEEQQARLQTVLEKSCDLLLPGEHSGLEPLTFHIYQKKHHQKRSDRRIFLIRWGMHQVFQQKHLPEFLPEALETVLSSSIRKNRQKIREALFNRCREILSDIVTLELEPALNSRHVFLEAAQLKVCNTRKSEKHPWNGGWPAYCIFLSWTDESGAFQEFIYPLIFEEKEKRFILSSDEIVSKFIRYRDTQL